MLRFWPIRVLPVWPSACPDRPQGLSSLLTTPLLFFHDQTRTCTILAASDAQSWLINDPVCHQNDNDKMVRASDYHPVGYS
jgi:hypothetical protein